MKMKEVLVIGAGIAGCAVALALARRGVAVSVMTSSSDPRIYPPPFIQQDCLEEKVGELQRDRQEHLICSRAHEQLANFARQSVDELLRSPDRIDREGTMDIHRCLREQLKQQPGVEWLSHYRLVELLTLDRDSLKQVDRYKRPACVGVLAYNHETHMMEPFLAKETILATGGAASLFPYSTHSPMACGEGMAIAYRAGVRLLNIDHIYFHPLGLFEKGHPCFPLPMEWLLSGGRLHAAKSVPLEMASPTPHGLAQEIYDHLFRTKSEHLWLDLTSLDHSSLKGECSMVEAYCLHRGYNIAKDLLPIVPVASYTCGGIAVDRLGQTSMQRLRALGEVACTGLFWNFKEAALSVLESLTWAVACAEDLAKQIDKHIYYFPEIKERPNLGGRGSSIIEEDWRLLRAIMWTYMGIQRTPEHLKRGQVLLDQLLQANQLEDLTSYSIEHIRLFHAIQAAQLIGRSVCSS